MSKSISIPLTQGKFALIDAADLPLLGSSLWQAKKDRSGKWYATTSRYRRTVRMYRLLLSAPPGLEVDHINGDGLDNRRSNLRLATRSQNGANVRMSSRNTSGFRGVVFHRQLRRWQAQIKVQGRTLYLGVFDDPEEAGRAYDAAAIEHFGEFANLNFPGGSE